jgi:hypothetical protein
MLTTSLILIVMQQSMSVVRFPITMMATFSELSTIQKRAHLKSRSERQKMEREEALRSRILHQQKLKSHSPVENV